MYAIIEFEKKECAFVPLSWLTESQTFCYWPRNTSQQGLDDMVKLNMAPKKAWPQYNVVKLLNMLGRYYLSVTLHVWAILIFLYFQILMKSHVFTWRNIFPTLIVHLTVERW